MTVWVLGVLTKAKSYMTVGVDRANYSEEKTNHECLIYLADKM